MENESGATLLSYAILVSLIAVAATLSVRAVGREIPEHFCRAAGGLELREAHWNHALGCCATNFGGGFGGSQSFCIE